MHAARPDAESHFKLAEDSPARVEDKPKTLQRQKGMGLYQDPLREDSRTSVKQPNIAHTAHTQPNQSRTSKARTDNDNTTDVSQAQAGQHQPNQSRTSKARTENESHWDFGTPIKDKKIYKTAGDGMGGRSGARSWGIGDDSDPETLADVRPSVRSNGRGGRAQAEAGADYSDF